MNGRAMNQTTQQFPAGGAIVFGGSGATGGATARLLAARGCDVAITYQSAAEKAEQTRAAIAATGRESFAARCDLLDAAAVDRVTAQAAEQFGGLHTIVLATGRVFSNRPLAEMDNADFQQQLLTDTIGFSNVIKATVPHLRKGGGAIVVIMGTTIERIIPNNALAAVPKLAQAGMIKFLAREEAANGIRVNGIAPGVIEDGMSRKVSAGNPAVIAAAAQATPMGRVGTLSEIAETALFLAGPGSGFITGQIVIVDGGMTL